MESLLSTIGKKITHNVGPESPTTSLPKDLFCKILTRIRDKNTITIDKLAVLKYADNTCYVQTISAKDTMEVYGELFEIDIANRTWRFGRQIFKIGRRRDCERGSRGGVIGVYNMFSMSHLDSMVHAATAAVESDCAWNCD